METEQDHEGAGDGVGQDGARGRREGTDDDEDDLFAGIPAEVAAADALATRADLPLVRDDRIAPTVEFHV